MNDDERRDWIEMKAFLIRAIPTVDNQLIFTDKSVSSEDYDFLIDKVKMYRTNLEQVLQLLQADDDSQWKLLMIITTD